jgi:mRNA interferase MazF
MAEKYRFGETVVVEYPYSDGRRSKFRPALVLSSQKDGDILFARITTKAPADSFDQMLIEWPQAGLMAPSTVRIEKLTSLLPARVKSRIGRISPRDAESVREALRNFIDSLSYE